MKIIDPKMDINDPIRGDYYGLLYDINRNSSCIRDDDSVMAKVSSKWHKQRLIRFQQHERIFDELLLKILEKSQENPDEDLLQQLIESRISLKQVVIKTSSFCNDNDSNELQIDSKVFKFVVNYLAINNSILETTPISPNENHKESSCKSSAVPDTNVEDTEDKKQSPEEDVASKSSEHIVIQSLENEIERNSINEYNRMIETINDQKNNETKEDHSVKTITNEFQSYPQTFNDISYLISNIDSIMNEITFGNVMQKTIEFKALCVDNSEKLKQIIIRMLEMIIKEFTSDTRIMQWAMYLENLMDFKVPNVEPNENNLVKFEDLFLKTCEKHFIMVLKNIDQDPFGQRKLIALSKIIAELYKLDALDGKLVLEYLNRFLEEDQTKESIVECFLLMIEKLGSDSMLKLQVYPIENDNQLAPNSLNLLIDRLKSILKNHGCKNYSRKTLNFSKEIIQRHHKNWLDLSGDHNSVYSSNHFSTIRKQM